MPLRTDAGDGTPRPNAEATRPIIEIVALSKAYRRGDQRVPVLNDINLALEPGAFVALMGPSGSGKSTLLNLIAGIDRPDSGRLAIDGVDITAMPDRDLARWRAEHVGFIFQFYNLMPVLTAFENVELPLLLTRLDRRARRAHAALALDLVGLSDRAEHYPGQLSGGQQQRVAIARALVTDPTLIVADEPTGDLDRVSAGEILDLLETLNTRLAKTIVMVTHDSQAAARAKTIRHLDKGVLTDDIEYPRAARLSA